MRPLIVCVTAIVMSIAASLTSTRAGQDEAPQHSIKEVMKVAHKDGLLKKVVGGNGSADEKLQLLGLYKSLAANKPPQGEAASWQEKTTAIVAAAQTVVDGGEAAGLKKAANCGGCHKAHKPKK